MIYWAVYANEEVRRRYGLDYSESGLRAKRSVTRSVADQGWEVRIVSPMAVNRVVPRLVPRWIHTDAETGLEVVYPSALAWLPPFNLLWSAVSGFREGRRMAAGDGVRVSLFYNWLPQLAIPVFLLRSFRGVPAVVEYEDGLFAGARRALVRVGARVVEAVFNRHLDGVVAVSSTLRARAATANAALKRGHVPGDVAAHDAREPFTHGARPRVLFGGRLDEVRGIGVFLRAAAELRDDPVELVVTGYGTDEELARVEAAARAQDNLRFGGRLSREAYIRELTSCDVAVSLLDPGHAFGSLSFPSKLTEILTAGRTLLTTSVPDLASFPPGLAVEVENHPRAVAERIRWILAHPEDCREMARRGRAWILDECSDEAVGRTLVGVLSAAVRLP